MNSTLKMWKVPTDDLMEALEGNSHINYYYEATLLLIFMGLIVPIVHDLDLMQVI
jgi:hypothetical protein